MWYPKRALRLQTFRPRMRCLRSDALGRAVLEEPRVIPRRLRGLPVVIPWLPPAAYRLLLELLWRDQAFCHLTLPYFHTNGYISLLACDGGRGGQGGDEEEQKAGRANCKINPGQRAHRDRLGRPSAVTAMGVPEKQESQERLASGERSRRVGHSWDRGHTALFVCPAGVHTASATQHHAVDLGSRTWSGRKRTNKSNN